MKPLDSLSIPLQRRTTSSYVPLTPIMRSFWNEDAPSTRQNAASVRILGPLNIDLLRKSIDAVVRRHESLRARIVVADGTPQLAIDEASDFELKIVDLSSGSPQDIASSLQLFGRDLCNEPIYLSTGPATAAKLLKLSDQEHVLLMVIHHAFMDGASCGIIRKEIWSLYDKAARGLPLVLPRLPLDFSDYAAWLEQTRDPWLEQHEAYWRRRLLGASYELPLDDRLVDVKKPAWTWDRTPLDTAMSGLRDIAWRERAPLPIAFLTALAIVMSRWLKQDDFVVQMMFHGRHNEMKLANMVGCLSHILHLRIEIPTDCNFIGLLRLIHREFLAAREHADYNRVPELIPECRSALIFNWARSNWSQWPTWKGEPAGPLTIQPFPMLPDVEVRSPVRSLFAAIPPDESKVSSRVGLEMVTGYSTNAIAPDTVDRFRSNFLLFVEHLTQRPLSPVTAAEFQS